MMNNHTFYVHSRICMEMLKLKENWGGGGVGGGGKSTRRSNDKIKQREANMEYKDEFVEELIGIYSDLEMMIGR